jgi:hypothetical protein
MKRILAAIVIVASGITGVFLWHAANPPRIDISSSQIYIHDTPVCVMRHGGEILASVGLCDLHEGQPGNRDFGNGDGFVGESPSYRDEPSGLPPGHPPVDSFPAAERLRRIPI